MFTIPKLDNNSKDLVLQKLKECHIVLLENIDELAFKNLCQQIGVLNKRYGDFYEVVDTGKDYKTTNIPISQTREDTGVHTDSSAKVYNPDYLSLFCVSPGLSGGESYFVDMRSIFKDLMDTDLDLLNYLADDFYRDVVTPGAENNLQNIKENKFPIIKFENNQLIEFRYMRYWIERAYKKLDCVEELNREMLDRLDSYLADQKYRREFQLQGNQAIIFKNSYFPHGRKSYIEDSDNPRKLIRVWFDFLHFS